MYIFIILVVVAVVAVVVAVVVVVAAAVVVVVVVLQYFVLFCFVFWFVLFGLRLSVCLWWLQVRCGDFPTRS